MNYQSKRAGRGMDSRPSPTDAGYSRGKSAERCSVFALDCFSIAIPRRRASAHCIALIQRASIAAPVASAQAMPGYSQGVGGGR